MAPRLTACNSSSDARKIRCVTVTLLTTKRHCNFCNIHDLLFISNRRCLSLSMHPLTVKSYGKIKYVTVTLLTTKQHCNFCNIHGLLFISNHRCLSLSMYPLTTKSYGKIRCVIVHCWQLNDIIIFVIYATCYLLVIIGVCRF